MKPNLSNIDFIVASRIDNNERSRNAFLCYRFFKEHSINSRFIFVEDSITPALAQYIPIEESDKIIFEKNEGAFRKSRSYNIGLKKSTRPFVCFLDLDCILDPSQLTTIEENLEKYQFGIPYNGICLYLNYNCKSYFEQNSKIAQLRLFSLDDKDVRHKLNELYHQKLRGDAFSHGRVRFPFFSVMGYNSVGGCLVGRRESFYDIGGFNENFEGWGYEDSEIISRIRILEKPIISCGKFEAVMYHFPHTNDTVTQQVTEHYDNYLENQKEVDKIEHMGKDELTKYIDSWQWLK